MLSNSVFYPLCYQVTKVTDLTPQGIIKLSLKQDDFNEKRDNVQLGICDYYTDEGNIKVDIPLSPVGVSSIAWKTLDSDGTLIDGEPGLLERGVTVYFEVVSEDKFDPEWHLELLTESDDEEYYVNLIQVTEFDDKVVAVKPRKAGSLVGKQFRLSVSDKAGNYYSSIDLEVK